MGVVRSPWTIAFSKTEERRIFWRNRCEHCIARGSVHWKTAGKAAVASLCVTACQACAATPAPVRCNACNSVSPIPCNTNTLQYLARNQLFQIYRPRYIPRSASLHSIIILQYVACNVYLLPAILRAIHTAGYWFAGISISLSYNPRVCAASLCIVSLSSQWSEKQFMQWELFTSASRSVSAASPLGDSCDTMRSDVNHLYRAFCSFTFSANQCSAASRVLQCLH